MMQVQATSPIAQPLGASRQALPVPVSSVVVSPDRFKVQRNASEQAASDPKYLTGITGSDFNNPAYGFGQKLGLGLIALYQRAFRKVDAEGNVVNTHRLVCRCSPSCSTFTAQAIKANGLLPGSWQGLKRMFTSCNPIYPLWQEEGFLKGSVIVMKAMAADVLRHAGKTIYPQELARVQALLVPGLQGHKIDDPVVTATK